MFYINPTNPMRPVLVGSPQSTLGDFPMSVAYSSKLSTGNFSFLLSQLSKIVFGRV